MGSADVVPGVSGGTIALITGIYEELVRSIRSFDLIAAKMLFQRNIKSAWHHINGWFLLILFAGISTAIISLSKIIIFLLHNHPEMVWSFFFGLIAASAISVSKRISIWSLFAVIGLLIGTAFGFTVTILVPLNTPEALWFIFLSGSIAICAMILPGISGSFILVLLGKYEFILTALKNIQLDIIITFSAGAAIGLLSFSHLLNKLLSRFYDLTLAVLIGIMLGSLNKVWPWKAISQTYIDQQGQIKTLTEINILPSIHDPSLIFAVIFALLGFVIVFVLDMLSSNKHTV